MLLLRCAAAIVNAEWWRGCGSRIVLVIKERRLYFFRSGSGWKASGIAE